MKPKAPGNLTVWSLFWIFGSGFVLVSALRGVEITGMVTAVSAIVLLCSIGLWFELRFCRTVLLMWFIMAAVGSIFLGFRGQPFYLVAFRTVMLGFCIYELWRWRGGLEED